MSVNKGGNRIPVNFGRLCQGQKLTWNPEQTVSFVLVPVSVFHSDEPTGAIAEQSIALKVVNKILD